MNAARIAELLHPFLPAPMQGEAAALSPAQLKLISTYIDLLIRWNARVNLTAIRDPEQIVTRHFGESFFAASHLFPARIGAGASPVRPERGERIAASPRVADVGSGAGFPGLPIKLWAPQISLTLIESNHKKSTFLREVTRALTLIDVNILTARAESLPPATFDVVTLRAVERFKSILPAAASLVASGGQLALLIGATQQSQAHAALPDVQWSAPIAIPKSNSRITLLAEVPYAGP